MLKWLFDGFNMTREEKQVGNVMFYLQDLHC